MANILPFGLQKTLPGTAFHPTRTKIVSFYLANKILGRQTLTEAAFIPFYDLYGDKEPWDIFQLFAPPRPCPSPADDDDDNDDAVTDIYFFTKLKKKSKNRIDRTVGKGTWHAEGKPDYYWVKVNGNCNIPACYKRYSYKNEEDSYQHGRWSLLEYSCSALSNDIVMCILRKNEGKGKDSSGSLDAPAPIPTLTPILKRKTTDCCPIATTEEAKRMRLEVEYTVEMNFDHNSEIIPAATTNVVKEWSADTSIISRSYSSNEDGCSGSSVSDCAVATGESDRTRFEAVEWPKNYEHNSEISPTVIASGVEEWSADTAIVSPSYRTEDVGCSFGSSDLSDWVDSYNFQVD